MPRTLEERIAVIVAQRNRRDPNSVYDMGGFRICPVCGQRKEVFLPDYDPNIPRLLCGPLRDLYTKCKVPVVCKCQK